MIKIIFFIIALFLLIFFLILLQKNSRKSFKVALLLGILLLIFLAFFFERKNLDKQNDKRALIAAFNQGKTLICDNFELDKNNFSYENGTASFIERSKKERRETFKSLIFDLSSCKLKDE